MELLRKHPSSLWKLRLLLMKMYLLLIGKSFFKCVFIYIYSSFFIFLSILHLYREVKTEVNADLPNSTEAIETCTRLITAPNESAFSKTEKAREGEGEGYSGGEDSDSNHNEPAGIKIPIERRPYYESTEKYRKTLRLTSEQIVSSFYTFCMRVFCSR